MSAVPNMPKSSVGATVEARHVEVEGRYAWARREARKLGSPDQLMVIKRVREVRTVLVAHYGDTMPDDGAGRDDLALLLGYVMQANPGNAVPAMMAEARALAPWLTHDERRKLVEQVAATKPTKLTADAIADRLGVTNAERNKLGLTTVGACDLTRAERNKATRKRRTDAERDRRRRGGAVSREQYEARSLSQTRPWEAEGVCRRTWERRRAKAVTSPACRKSVATESFYARQALATPHPASPPSLSDGDLKVLRLAVGAHGDQLAARPGEG
jgi:hypothetical protein